MIIICPLVASEYFPSLTSDELVNCVLERCIHFFVVIAAKVKDVGQLVENILKILRSEALLCSLEQLSDTIHRGGCGFVVHIRINMRVSVHELMHDRALR